jgi:hypothetical protein
VSMRRREGSRWGGRTEATGGERAEHLEQASHAQQGGGQRRRSDTRCREADSGRASTMGSREEASGGQLRGCGGRAEP